MMITTRPISQVGIKDFWLALCVSLPSLIRIICPSGIESLLFEVTIADIPFYWPNLLLIFFIANAKPYKGSKLIKLLLFIQLIAVFWGVLLNRYNHTLAFLLSGNYYFYAFFIGICFSISEGQRYWISRFFSICVILLSLEVLLYSSGILTSYQGTELTTDLEDYGGIERISTTAGAATGTACDLYLMIVLCMMTTSNKKRRLFVFAIGFVALLLTVSRGGIFAMFFYLAFSIIDRMKNTRHKSKIVVTTIVALGVIYYVRLFNPFLDRLQVKNESSDMSSGREALAAMTLNNYYQNADVLALGLGFANVYPSTEIQHAGYIPTWPGAPHNMYVLTLAEQGWLGLLLTVWIILIILFSVRKNKTLLFSLIPVFLILYNTETVIGVNCQELFIVMIILSISLDQKHTYLVNKL